MASVLMLLGTNIGYRPSLALFSTSPHLEDGNANTQMMPYFIQTINSGSSLAENGLQAVVMPRVGLQRYGIVRNR